MTNSTTTTIVSAIATPAQKRVIEQKQIVTPLELAAQLKFPLYAFTAQGKATKGAEVFCKHHHFCHVGFEDFKALMSAYNINNVVLARMMEGVGKQTAREGFLYVSYDQQIGAPNPYKTRAPYRKGLQDFLSTLPREVVIVSSNKLVLELASNMNFRVLHRPVQVARAHNIEHVSVLKGMSKNGLTAVHSLFYGIKSRIVTY